MTSQTYSTICAICKESEEYIPLFTWNSQRYCEDCLRKMKVEFCDECGEPVDSIVIEEGEFNLCKLCSHFSSERDEQVKPLRTKFKKGAGE